MKRVFLIIISLLVLTPGFVVMSDEIPAKGNIHHLVIFWLKTPGDAVARSALIDATKSFSTIPGVISVSAGPALASDRVVVDDSFDVAITITFADEAAEKAYQKNPVHVKLRDEKLKALVEKFIVYDFID